MTPDEAADALRNLLARQAEIRYDPDDAGLTPEEEEAVREAIHALTYNEADDE